MGVRVKETVQSILDKTEIPAGFAVSGGLITLPVWVQAMSAWAQALSPIIGVIVGVLTAYVLIRKIFKEQKQDDE